MANIPGVLLMADNDALFSVYQDWLHQNTGIQLDGRINKDGKWQARWENLSVYQPNDITYRLEGSGFFCLNPREWA